MRFGPPATALFSASANSVSNLAAFSLTDSFSAFRSATSCSRSAVALLASSDSSEIFSTAGVSAVSSTTGVSSAGASTAGGTSVSSAFTTSADAYLSVSIVSPCCRDSTHSSNSCCQIQFVRQERA